VGETEGHGPASALPDRNARIAALCAMLAIYFFSYFQRAAIPGTIFNEIQTDMRLSAAAVTALGAVFTYVYGGAQLFVGIAVDRFGGIRALLIGGIAMTTGAAVFPLAHSPAMLYASRILTAVGASVMYLSVIKEICLLFAPQRFAALLGVVLMVGYAGGLAGMLPFERLATFFGWRHALLGIAAVMAAALFVAWRLLRHLEHFRPPAHPFSLRPLWSILRNGRNVPLLLISLIHFPTYFTIQAILGKKFLQDFASLGSASAAVFTTVMIATTAICSISAALLLPWTGHRRKPWIVLGGCLMVAATALLLGGVIVHADGRVFLAAYLAMAAAMLSTPALTATVKEFSRPESVGLSIAVMNGLAYLGAGVIGNLSGVVLDRFKDRATVTAAGTCYPAEAYATDFGMLVCVALASLITAFFVRETHGRTVEDREAYRRSIAGAGGE
jgi:predicted MFS family arabinose efflux permease